MNLTPWAWLILPFAMTRAMQLVLHDRILNGPRNWFAGKVNPRGLEPPHPDLSYLGYLYQCQWCITVWIGAVAVAGVLWDATRAGTLAVALVLALSLVAVMIDRVVDEIASDERAALREAMAKAAAPSAVDDAFDRAESGDQTSSGG